MLSLATCERQVLLLQATMAWESQDDGFIAKILLQEGAKDIPVGTPAMVFVEEEVWACAMP